MKNPNLISFKRTDIVRDEIEEIILQLANHFKVRRTYLPDFCRLFYNSKRWNMSNLENSLIAWAEKFLKIEGTKKTVELVSKAFRLCDTDEEINHLRGLLVEALVIARHGGSACFGRTDFGWGAKVYLNIDKEPAKVIKYTCMTKPKPYDHCGDRVTIDFGFWNGHHGKFYECKVQPISVRCKEINYMKELANELKGHGISFEIFFMCPTSCEAVQAILLDHELDTVTFKPIGYDNLYS